MKKFKMIQLINKVETRIEETVLSKKIKTEIAQMLLDVKNEAINYTRCCESVKGEQVPTFDEWLRVEDIKMHQDGTFYISSERRYVELTFLINRYNSLNL